MQGTDKKIVHFVLRLIHSKRGKQQKKQQKRTKNNNSTLKQIRCLISGRILNLLLQMFIVDVESHNYIVLLTA
jgi:uncharacterized protein YehS (DUF1456 family)